MTFSMEKHPRVFALATLAFLVGASFPASAADREDVVAGVIAGAAIGYVLAEETGDIKVIYRQNSRNYHRDDRRHHHKHHYYSSAFPKHRYYHYYSRPQGRDHHYKQEKYRGRGHHRGNHHGHHARDQRDRGHWRSHR